MKTVLPANAKIAKDAKETIQECVSEFISFITSEASDRCLQEKRKTINGDDLLWAMTTLGFDRYIDPLKLYLSKYRDAVKGERPDKKAVGNSSKRPDSLTSSSVGMIPNESYHLQPSHLDDGHLNITPHGGSGHHMTNHHMGNVMNINPLTHSHSSLGMNPTVAMNHPDEILYNNNVGIKRETHDVGDQALKKFKP